MVLKSLLPDDYVMVFLAVLEGVVRKGGARREVGSRPGGCQNVSCAKQGKPSPSPVYLRH